MPIEEPMPVKPLTDEPPRKDQVTEFQERVPVEPQPINSSAPKPSENSSASTPVANTSSRPKVTLDLNSVFKGKPTEAAGQGIVPIEEPMPVKPLTDEQLREAWAAYAALRKDQVAEFHLLSRQVDVQGSVVTVALANTVEGPLLQAMMPDLITYLRHKLSNPTIKIESVMKETEGKRMVYTNKEKFEFLTEKNPLLMELKNRLGLDEEF